MPFYITVDGADKEKERIEDYVYNVLKYFFKKEPRRNIDIEVTFNDELDANAFGYCLGDMTEINIEIGRGATWPVTDTDKTEYVPYSIKDQMMTLSHELVHAKQYLRGDIKGYDRIWRKDGQYIDCSHIKDDKKLPWEIEAYDLEDKLYKTFWLGEASE